jgi:hypothetical protein
MQAPQRLELRASCAPADALVVAAYEVDEIEATVVTVVVQQPEQQPSADAAALGCSALVAQPCDPGGLLGRRQPQWSTGQTCCSSCSADFTLLRRRHHCRACGAAVCAACSSNKLYLTRWLASDRPTLRPTQRRAHPLVELPDSDATAASAAQRVCDTCHRSAPGEMHDERRQLRLQATVSQPPTRQDWFTASGTVQVALVPGIETLIAALNFRDQERFDSEAFERGCRQLPRPIATQQLDAACGLLVHGMAALPSSLTVQIASCRALARSCIGRLNKPAGVRCSESEDAQRWRSSRVAELGGIEAVVAAMLEHPHSATLQWLGCVLLGRLAYGQKALGKRVRRAGGWVVASNAMRQHSHSVRVVLRALRVFNSCVSTMGAGAKRARLVESEAEGVRSAVEQLERLRLQMPDDERRLLKHVGSEVRCTARLLY